MRKWIAAAGLAYVLYGLFFYWYFFMTGDSAVPEAVKGTKADPSSFMDPGRLAAAENFSNVKDFLFFIGAPLDWFLFFLLLITGLAKNKALAGSSGALSGAANRKLRICDFTHRYGGFASA